MLGNGFNILGKIGQGKFIDVFAVRSPTSGEVLAAKVPKSEKAVSSESLKVLEALRKHPHPNLVNQKGLFENDGLTCSLEEFIEGGDLLKLAQQSGRMPEPKVKQIFLGLVDALDHIHNLGITHRDVKLENILVTHTGVKLCDFNLSGFFEDGVLLERVCGSIMYGAPEIFFRIPYDGRKLDIWSLGVVLYCLVFNRFPFSSPTNNAHEVATLITSGEFCLDYAGASDEAKDLISKILQVNAMDRPSLAAIRQHPWLSEEVKKAQTPAKHQSPRFSSSQQELSSAKKTSDVKPKKGSFIAKLNTFLRRSANSHSP